MADAHKGLDPFDDPVTGKQEEISRDRWGRPEVVPLGGGTKVGYTRCTTFVNVLDDQTSLTKWKQRLTALGLAERDDLLLEVASLKEEADTKEGKKKLQKVAEQAADVAGASSSSRRGTAIHKLTEAVDEGKEVSVPPAYRADIDAYKRATELLEMVSMEQFVVQDKHEVGDTYDRIWKYRGRYYVGDLKTGGIDLGHLKIACQMAEYANSVPYIWWDIEALNDTVDGKPRQYTKAEAAGLRAEHPFEVDRDRAILIHLPQGGGRCLVYWVDIHKGWQAVQVAKEVREWRKVRNFLEPLDPTLEEFTDRIQSAATIEELYAIHDEWTNGGRSSDDIIMWCRSRKAFLLGGE